MATYRPLCFEDRWLWHNADHRLVAGGDYGDHLPGPLHDALTGFIPKPANVTALVKAYPSREAAMVALHVAQLRRAEGTS